MGNATDQMVNLCGELALEAFPDRSTGSWHQTSEMIQEDMKIDPTTELPFPGCPRSLREKKTEKPVGLLINFNVR